MFLNNQSFESINKHEQLKVNLNLPHKSQQIVLQKNNISYTLLNLLIEDNAYRFILFGVFSALVSDNPRQLFYRLAYYLICHEFMLKCRGCYFKRVVKGGSRSCFTGNKTVLSQFMKNVFL